MNMVRVRGRLGAFLALAGILGLCGAAPVAAQLQRGQLRLEVRDPAGGGVAARGEILSQGNEFQRGRFRSRATATCSKTCIGV